MIAWWGILLVLVVLCVLAAKHGDRADREFIYGITGLYLIGSTAMIFVT